jgi:hypothetical protein
MIRNKINVIIQILSGLSCVRDRAIDDAMDKINC